MMNEDKQRRVPLFEAMKVYAKSGTLAFHTPGHKQGLGADKFLKELITDIGLRAEVSLMDELDDPHNPTGCIKEAQHLAAELYDADATFFMVNGTTGAIHTMVMATLSAGDEVLLPRNVHRSVMGALTLSGALPVYLEPDIDERTGLILGISEKTLLEAVKNHPKAKAFIAVYPNYYGITCDLKRISEILHASGMLLLVDEAHGAHLKFSVELPKDALSLGADMVAQSTHKLLGSLTQTSLLHIKKERVDVEKVRKTMALLASTSPNYLLLASLDVARRQMALEGAWRLERALKIARFLRAEINKIDGLRVFGREDLTKPFDLDELKITVNVSEIGLSGQEAAISLRQDGLIQSELVDAENVLFIITMADTQACADKLLESLKNLARGKKRSKKPQHHIKLPPMPEVVLSLREAFFAERVTVPFDTAEGMVCAEEITFYPPGIPAICPGERFTREMMDYIQAMKMKGIFLTGARDKMLKNIDIIRMDRK